MGLCIVNVRTHRALHFGLRGLDTSTKPAARFRLAWPTSLRARAQSASLEAAAARSGQEILLWEDEAAQEDFEA